MPGVPSRNAALATPIATEDRTPSPNATVSAQSRRLRVSRRGLLTAASELVRSSIMKAAFNLKIAMPVATATRNARNPAPYRNATPAGGGVVAVRSVNEEEANTAGERPTRVRSASLRLSNQAWVMMACHHSGSAPACFG